MYFLLCPKQGLKIEGGVPHRVYILGLFCPKQGQGLKPSAAPLYPTIGQVSPPGFDFANAKYSGRMSHINVAPISPRVFLYLSAWLEYLTDVRRVMSSTKIFFCHMFAKTELNIIVS